MLKGGKGKGRKSKDGKNKDAGRKAKVKEDKDKTDPKSNSNMDKKCFYCDKIGHVKADCRKKKRDDDECKTTLAQNSLTSSPITSDSARTKRTWQRALLGPALPLSNNSLSRLTEFHSPMRIFALKASSPTDRVMVDSGAAHSDCPPDYADEHEVREVQHKIQFQTASGKLHDHHGEKLVPYMTQDTIMGITYQAIDVDAPVAAVSSMDNESMAVVFSPQGAWVCNETPLKLVGSIELKRENRTFGIELALEGCSA